MKKYARNLEEAEAYIERNYDVKSRGFSPWDGRTSWEKSFFFADGGWAEYCAIECACGESSGWRVYDAEGEITCKIIECESCYEDAEQAEQI